MIGTVTLRDKQTKKGTSLYLDIYLNGKRKYEFLGLYLTGNKEQDKATELTAEQIRIERLVEVQRLTNGLEVLSKITIEEVISELAKNKTKRKTKDNYQTLTAHLNNFDQNFTVKQIAKTGLDYLERFREYLLNAPKLTGTGNISRNAANNYITTFKAVFNYAIRKGYIRENPMMRIEPIKKVDTERGYLTIDEFRRLQKCDFIGDITNSPNLNQIHKAFLFSCLTGIRFSDIRKLTFQDITDGKIKVKMTKTDRFIYIPLNEEASRIISELSAGKVKNIDGRIFNLPNISNVNRALKRILHAIGIEKEKVSFHLSRHTFATVALTLGIDLMTVSKILGHRNLSTTQIYAKIIDKKMTEGMNKFNGIFKSTI